LKTIVGRSNIGAGVGPVAVTIGTFDGVHVGHRALIERAKQKADELGVTSAVLTWDRHPAETLRPDKAPPLLVTPEQKVELIEATGVDLLVVLEFDKDLSSWPPERFVDEVLVAGLQARCVLVGEGWRFGRKATGDVSLLKKMAAENGFDVEVIGLAQIEGGPASSSRVRETVAAGDMGLARALLGRPFEVVGPVVRGDDRGHRIGWPTANLVPGPRFAHPPRGVYAGRARFDGESHRAAINVGVNPTFGGDPSSTPIGVEAYLLDFDGDLYGKTVAVEFHERLRDELTFDSAEALSAQIKEDVEATRRLT
jgi:riboflavin kinase / FMN adenylyltransferase